MPFFNTIGYQTGFLAGAVAEPPPISSNYGSLRYVGNAGFAMGNNALITGIGTGGWTFEAYYYYNRYVTGAHLHAIGTVPNLTVNVSLRHDSSETSFRGNLNGGGASYPIPLQRGRWFHLAVSRPNFPGAATRYYLNGSTIGSFIFTNSLSTTTGGRDMVGNIITGGGAAWGGYVTNARFTASGIYASTFVPSSSYLEATNSTLYLIRSETSSAMLTDLSPFTQATSTVNNLPMYWADFSPFTFSPANLLQTAAWFDAFTFFGSNSGQVTGSWLDKSVGGLTYTSVNNPTLQLNEINGLPVVRLNGTNQYYSGSGLNIGLNHIGLFAVVRFSTTDNGSVITKNGGNSVAGKWGLFRSNAEMRFTVSPTTTTTVSTVFSDTSTNPQILGAYWDRSRMYLYKNGTFMTSTVLVDAATNFSIANATFIGAHNNASGTGPLAGMYLNGDIAEVCVTLSSVTLTASSRQKMEGAMAWRWGLQGNLPSDHPYKTARPINSNLFGLDS